MRNLYVIRLMACRSWITLVVIAALAAAGILTELAWRRPRARPFTDQSIVAVTLDLSGLPSGRATASAEVSDPLAIRRLTQMLNRGVFTEPHPCTDIGQLILKRGDRSQLLIEILPGHDADFFEYRYGGAYRRVSRADFLDAVAAFGVPVESFAGPGSE